jgi:Zinc knuckle
MALENLTCFGCGDKGHLERDCPNRAATGTDGKPPWCGFCDERTRLIDHGETASRCQECHPARRKQLRQHRKCPLCHVTIYEWDNAPCGNHHGPASPDNRPPRQRIDEIITAGRITQ